MKEIGGYFELELSKCGEYYKDLIKLNSGRSAFKYILQAKAPAKVYVPNYICDSVIEPLEALNIKYEFYNIDESFEIIQDVHLEDNELLFYVNYFAMKSKYISRLAEKYNTRLVVDNTQAFFEKPLEFIDTIYSPRKFFGVSDGGYVSTKLVLDEALSQDESYESSLQLLGRADKDASSFYDKYQQAEQRLVNQPIKQMSKLTQKILSSIDYENAIKIRKENFNYLHTQLGDMNKIKIEKDDLDFVPFVYPLMISENSLREKLIENKIYVAKYWNEVLERVCISEIEKSFVNNIIPLPIDQRYNLDDMQNITKIIYRSLLSIEKNNDLKMILNYFNVIDNKFSKVLGSNNSFLEYCDKLSKNAEIYYLKIGIDNIGILAFYANNFNEKKAFLSSISIFSKYHGNGFGKLLLEFLENYLKKINFKEVFLEVEKTNLHAIGFYKKFGFNLYEKKPDSVIMFKKI